MPHQQLDRPHDALDSWKAIARYLDRDVRTAMRWERSRSLPVHRLPGGPKAAVYALKSELDRWRGSQALSVAVSPFSNLTSEKEIDHLARGLAEEIAAALSRTGSVRVVAREKTAGMALLEGSLQRAGGRIRIHAQLLSAADAEIIWCERYDRPITDTFDMEDEIAESIARAVAAALSSASRQCPIARRRW
jgi:TolB-like protein